MSVIRFGYFLTELSVVLIVIGIMANTTPRSVDSLGPAAVGRRRRIAGCRVRWYYAAALAILLLAAVLRFYDLSGNPLDRLEAETFGNSQGDSPREFLIHQRTDSHPVTHPLLLRAVQEVAVSRFSIRALPALASLLTVAAILFLLPRCGFDRRAALMAGLLATVSVAAIELAQNGRSYSLAALSSVLIIGGLLRYLRTGRKTLFAVTLFLAPLLNYGSAIFGIAALAAALVAGRPMAASRNGAPGNRYSRPARLWHWLQQRKDLAAPGASWLAGSAATGALSLLNQWQWAPSGSGKYFFDWDAPLTAALPFTVARLWESLTWLLPSVVAALAVGAFGIILFAALARRRFHPVLLLTLAALGIGVALSLLRFYPLGATRQTAYLAPLLFLAAGWAFCGAADRLAAYARREWLAPALLAALALLSGLAGAAAIRAAEVYAAQEDPVADFYAVLKEQVQADDAVYASGETFLQALFYLWRTPAYHREWVCRSDAVAACREEIVNLTLREQPAAQRLWFIYWGEPGLKETVLQAWEQQGLVERILIDRGRAAWLMRDSGWLRERQAALELERRDITAGEPAARGVFDLYLRDNTLYYHKEPCNTAKYVAAAVVDDPRGRFFLNLIPLAAADLPPPQLAADRRELSFTFWQRGTELDSKCFAKVPLPDYDFPLAEIRAGQYVDAGGPLWAAVIDRKPDYFRSVYPAITAAAPAAQGVFDLYLTADALYYYREPCLPADTTRRFFLHLIPADAADLPAEGQQHGFDNRDFAFDRYGAAFDGKCMARVRLPNYPIAAIKTGQFVIGEPPAWSVELAVEP